MMSKANTSTQGTTTCRTLLNFSCKSVGLTAARPITPPKNTTNDTVTIALTLFIPENSAASISWVLGKGKAKSVSIKASRKSNLTIWKKTKASYDCMQPRCRASIR